MRRRLSAIDPETRDGPFAASAEGNARGPSGSKTHGGGGASEGKCRPEAILLAEVRASPSSTVMKRKGAVPSRGVSSKQRSSMRVVGERE